MARMSAGVESAEARVPSREQAAGGALGVDDRIRAEGRRKERGRFSGSKRRELCFLEENDFWRQVYNASSNVRAFSNVPSATDVPGANVKGQIHGGELGQQVK
jgi:hypothetical protein